jgi:hypothetical protein
VVLAIALCLSGCGSDGRSNGPWARELSTLRSSANGLYFPPFLRGEAASLPEVSAALRVARLLGEPVRLDLTPEDRRRLVADARTAGPVLGSYLLASLPRSARPDVWTARQLRTLRTPGGWYTGSGHDSPAARAESTYEALATLAARDELTPRDVSRSTSWLTRQASAPDVAVSAPAVDALRVLGREVAGPIQAPRPPGIADFPHLTQDEREEALLRSYSYARLQHAAGQPANLEGSLWLRVLGRSVEDLPYPDLYRLTFLLRTAGVAASSLGAVSRRLADDRLPSGLVRDPSSFVGDPLTTLYVLALLGRHHETVRDPELARTIRRTEAEHHPSGTADDKMALEAGLSLSSGTDPDEPAFSTCGRSAAVAVESAPAWQRHAFICDTVGFAVGAPLVTPWALDSPQGAVAAARLANATRSYTHGHHVPVFFRQGDLVAFLADPDRLGNLGNFAEVARAAADLGSLSAGTRHMILATVQAARGCPGQPALYRATSEPFSCDLATTLSVEQLKESLS